MSTVDAPLPEHLASLRRALRGLRDKRIIRCEALDVYERHEELPDDIRDQIRDEPFISYAVARRRGRFAAMPFTDQLVLHAAMIAQVIAKDLDRELNGPRPTEEPDVSERQVRIVSDGTPAGTKVYVRGDGDSETELTHVGAIEWELAAGNIGVARVTIHNVEIEAVGREAEPTAGQFRSFGINLHFRLGRRLFPWWATMTHGMMNIGDAGGGVWHARSREKLIAKCERVARRIAKDWGIPPSEIKITVREHQP